MNLVAAIITHDLLQLWRNKTMLLLAPAFFVISMMLFPFGLGSDPSLLSGTAPGLISIVVLWTALMPLGGIFEPDRRDGTLDLMALSGRPLSLYVAGKVFAHWLLYGLPLLLISPWTGMMLGLDLSLAGTMMLVLFPVTWLLTLTGALGAALMLHARQSAMVLYLLLIPLYIPVLIFGAAALDMAYTGMDSRTPVMLLWALLAALAPVTPFAGAAILREQTE